MGPRQFLTSLPFCLSGIFLLFILVGLMSVAREATRNRLKMEIWLGLFLSFLLSGLVFTAMFRMGANPLLRSVNERFYALPLMLLIPFLARGLQTLRANLSAPLTAATLLLCLGFHVMHEWPFAERRSEVLYETYLRNLCQIAEKNALILASGDLNFFGLKYAQSVLGLRPDLDIVETDLLASRWYADEARRQIFRYYRPERQVAQGTDSGGKKAASFVDAVLPTRPVYLTELGGFAGAFVSRSYPFGPFIKLAVPNVEVPTVKSLLAQNQRLYSTMTLPSPYQIGHVKAWEAGVLIAYQGTWVALFNTLNAQGLTEAAKIARARAKYFWQSSRSLVLTGRLFLNEDGTGAPPPRRRGVVADFSVETKQLTWACKTGSGSGSGGGSSRREAFSIPPLRRPGGEGDSRYPPAATRPATRR